MLSAIAHYHCLSWADSWQRCRDSACTSGVWDRWLCTRRTKVRNEPRYERCPAVYYYLRQRAGVVGGPSFRGLDRRYGPGFYYRCKHVGGAWLRHETAPDPDQPAQDPELFEIIERLQLVAKEARRKRARKRATPDAAASSAEGIRPARSG